MPLFICKGSLNVNFVTIILQPRNKLKPMLGSTTRRLKQEKSISVIYVGKYLTINLFYTITECFTNLPTIRNCKNRPKDKRLPNHPEGQLHLTQETATPVQPPLAPEKPSSSQQPGAATAQSDLLLIGHAVVQPKDDPDLEATLEQIQEEEEAEQEVKEQEQ